MRMFGIIDIATVIPSKKKPASISRSGLCAAHWSSSLEQLAGTADSIGQPSLFPKALSVLTLLRFLDDHFGNILRAWAVMTEFH